VLGKRETDDAARRDLRPHGKDSPMTSDQESHRQHAAQRQEIIAETVRTHAGAPIDDVIDVLRERMSARGLQPPPGKWLEAVARDASAGRTYVESYEALADSGTDVPSLHPDASPEEGEGQDGEEGTAAREEAAGGGPSLSSPSPTAEGGVVRDDDGDR
jgi:hypothetical protein